MKSVFKASAKNLLKFFFQKNQQKEKKKNFKVKSTAMVKKNIFF